MAGYKARTTFEALCEQINWRTADPALWAQARTGASGAIETIFESALNRAFSTARLDRNNPDDWRSLAVVLAVAVYAGTGNRDSRETIWDNDTFLTLANDYERVAAKFPKQTQIENCELLLKEQPYANMAGIGDASKKLTAKTLARRLPEGQRLRAILARQLLETKSR